MPDADAAGNQGLSRARAMLFSLLGVLSIAALLDTAHQYDEFAIPQDGPMYIDVRELGFLLWYTFWGGLAVVCFSVAIWSAPIKRVLPLAWSKLHLRPRLTVWIAAVVVLFGALFVRYAVLKGEPIADDESVYAFEAQTLAHGRITNPVPDDAWFLENVFILITPRGWYGKYPIGHPLVLALGELVGARWLVVPLIGLLSMVLAFAVGRRLFNERAALLGVCLLCTSPQFVWTHATQMSQPTCMLLMLALMWAVLVLHERLALRYAALAGALSGALVLVRPLPGALFVVAALAGHLALSGWPRDADLRGRLLQQMLMALPCLAAGVAVIAWVNFVQSGSPWVSGYHSSHGGLGDMPHDRGELSLSLGGALLRQNFWLLGWVCSFMLVPFARVGRGAMLFWAMIAADLVYRIVQPKTMVATTGPIYVFESVPLWVLASGDGAIRLVCALRRRGVQGARELVGGTILAASLVALIGFVPVQFGAMMTSSASRRRIHHLLEERGARRALVFVNRMVAEEHKTTWAYWPPNPNPDMSDALLFARVPPGPHGPRAAYDYWRKHMPDRRAFVFIDTFKATHFEEFDAQQRPSAVVEGRN